MTEATITNVLEINSPTEEVVVLTASDTETYISKKFSTITAVQATLNEDTGALSIPLSIDLSGATAIINATGLSDDLVCLTLYGRK